MTPTNSRPSPRFLVISVFTLISCVRTVAVAEDDLKPRDKETISYPSDGLTITGLISKPEGKGPFPLVLVNHGGFAPAKNMGGFMDLFVNAGYVALASDYRGTGQSEGKHEFAKGEVDDVLNAISYARGLPFVDGDRIVTLGASHGAAISLLAASRDSGIKAVVAVQGPVELAECYRHWVANQSDPALKPLASTHLYVGGTPDQFPEAWKERSALYVAPKIKCPVLLVYSDHDSVIPTDQGPRMEKALKTAGNAGVKLTMVKGANHGLDTKLWVGMFPPMLDFFRQALQLPTPDPK